jgi:hypothetical protein
MLTDAEATDLLNALKELKSKRMIKFPSPGSAQQLDVNTKDGKDKFIIDINRKGKISLSKCTYQTRYKNSIKLLRLDIDGPPHTNPDSKEVPCPHLHIYKEGFAVRWAYPIGPNIFKNTSDLVQTLIDFLEYNYIENIPNIQLEGGLI